MMEQSGKMEAKLPRLTDDNFEQWTLSLRMITLALGIALYVFPNDLEHPVDPKDLKDEPLRMFYLLSNTMMNSIDPKL